MAAGRLAVADEPGAVQRQRTLVEALAGHLHGDVRVVETHISFVLLAGEHAYKFKKPVRLPFLDFSTLAKRRRMCLAELRLNAALAPGLYLDVVPVTGTVTQPSIGAPGRAIEYAVRMRRFPSDAEFPVALEADTVRPEHLRLLAQRVAGFHASTPAATTASGHGSARALREDFLASLETIGKLPGSRRRATVAALRRAGSDGLDRLARLVERRRRRGRVRACHGDMHLGNLVLVEDRVLAFDCIEFNDAFRYVDVASEIAFLSMDLRLHGRPDLASVFVDAYLEQGGDYQALSMLRWYEAYRATVRARVAAIRLAQLGRGEGTQAARREVDRHLALAVRSLRQGPAPILVLTHGLPGCGKSWIAERLVRSSGAVRVRSDRERRRLHAAGERYGASAIHSAYGAVLEQTEKALAAGWSVIADATFTALAERSRFLERAARLGVRAVILDVRTPASIQRQRVAGRRSLGNDPSEADAAVLEMARERAEPLTRLERAQTVAVDGAAPPAAAGLWARLRRRARVPPPPA